MPHLTPSPPNLTTIANDWRWLAIAGRVLLGVSIVLFLAGLATVDSPVWKPARRAAPLG